MIELKNVRFAYGDREVICGVDLTVRPGESCALMGKNGCGKTTLVRLMGRQAAPDSGEITLDGRGYESFSSREFAGCVSVFPQSRPLPDMTVRDYVAYGRYPYAGLSFRLTDEDRRAIGAAFELTCTARFADRPLAELSGGERQLVYLAMQLAQDSEYMILDEPCASLDAANTFAITDVLAAAAGRGKSVLAIMHDIPHALRCFDRVLLMDGGRIVYDGPAEGAADSGAIDTVFGVNCLRVDGGDYIIRKKI